MAWSNTEYTIHFKTDKGKETTVQVNGAPAVASRSLSNVDVFVRDMDNHLYHNLCVSGTWPGNWKDISAGHKFTTSPAAVTWGPDRVDLFAVWDDNKVHHRVLNGSIWANWDEDLGGATHHAPAAVSFFPTSFEVFVRGIQNGIGSSKNHLNRKIWKNMWPGINDWPDLDAMGGGISSAPAAVVSAPGHIDFFAVNEKGRLEHRMEDGAGQPTAWTEIAQKDIHKLTASPLEYDAPAAASAITAGGRVDVFVRDADNRLQKRWFNMKTNQKEDDWVDTGGSINSAPTAVAWYESTIQKRFDVFAQGKNNTLFHTWWNG